MGVTLFAVHLGGWDSNPPSVIKLSRSASSFLAPHPQDSFASFRGNESHHMFAVLVNNRNPWRAVEISREGRAYWTISVAR